MLTLCVIRAYSSLTARCTDSADNAGQGVHRNVTDLIAGLARFVLRLVLLAAGLVFAAALLVALMLLVAFWMLRAAWAKLTGRPVMPFVMRMNPRSGFEHVFRAGQGMQRQPPQPPGRREIADVTDVEPKEPR